MKADVFLQLYRTYESLLRDVKGTEPKDEETKVDDLTGGRLRMCRQFRNYLVHTQDPGFIEVSDKMGKFLTDYVNELKSQGDVAKKHMKKPDACVLSIKAHVSDALDVFGKTKRDSIVIDMCDGTYGLLSVYGVLGAPSRGKLESLQIKKCKPAFCSPFDDYASLDSDKVTLCTNDGTPSGKLLGQIMF